jgi:hypothetical protein
MKPKNQTKKKRTNKRKTKKTVQTVRAKHMRVPVILRIKTRKIKGGRDRQYKFDVVKYKSPTGEDMVNVDVLNDPIVVDGFLDLGNIIKVFSKYAGEIENELIITQKGLTDKSSEGKGILVTVRDKNYIGSRQPVKGGPPLSGSSNKSSVSISVGSSDKNDTSTNTSTNKNTSTSTNTSTNKNTSTSTSTNANKNASSVAVAPQVDTGKKTKNKPRMNADKRAQMEAPRITGQIGPKREVFGKKGGDYDGLDDSESRSSDSTFYPSSTSSSSVYKPTRPIGRSQRNK